MKKTIVFCDYCKKEIFDAYYYTLQFTNRYQSEEPQDMAHFCAGIYTRCLDDHLVQYRHKNGEGESV